MANVAELLNSKSCVICYEDENVAQNGQKKESSDTISNERGRKQIKHAASIRQDHVFYRLKLLPDDAVFYYHMDSNCYKKYTHKNVLKKLADTKQTTDVSDRKRKNSEPSNPSEQRQSKRRSTDCNRIEKECVICDKVCHNGVKKTVEISKIKAEFLLQATKFFEDEIYLKIASYETPGEIVAAKLNYHRACFRSYERKYERSVKSSGNVKGSRYEAINNAIKNVIKSIEPKIKVGEKLSLNYVSNILVQEHGPDFTVKNSKIKSSLIDYFGEDICFVYQKQKNKSQIFYLTKKEPNFRSINGEEIITDYIEKLKSSLDTINFDLEDRFCDAFDLELAFKNMKIPHILLLFFSKLFDCDVNDIMKDQTLFTDDIKLPKTLKMLRIKVLFQMIYSIKHNGMRKTPFHCLLGSYVYFSTKSKNVINVLNRTGFTVSYEQLLRTRTRLGEHAKNCSSGNVPLPSHINKHGYATASMDNFDHNEDTISGLNTSHDSVIIIVQDEDSNIDQRKPKLSECNIDKRTKTFATLLKCQEIQPYMKKKQPLQLPADYEISSDLSPLTIDDYKRDFCVEDCIWFLSRMGFSDDQILEVGTDDQVIPSWSAFNSALESDDRCIQKVGYLPIVPAPITQEATVYTCLCNLIDVLRQLDQEYLAVTCDEGVYRIARPMVMSNPDEFKNLIICLGNFHLIKVSQTCIGKYLKGSGIENVFYETDLFGINVIEQIFNGTSYARCVKALSYLAESLKRLQFKEFFASRGLENYENEISTIISLQATISEKSFEEAKKFVDSFKRNCSNLMIDFENFVEERCEESELFKYWTNILILISLMFDLIRADRTGNWHLHLRTVRKLIPIFHALDRSNYARWCALYIEDMMMLAKNAPEVYQQFLKGRFTVKQSSVPFTSVATDQALEQTINRTSKSTKGIIGTTRKKESVAVWDLTFHEFLAMANYLKKMVNFSNDDEEYFRHHEFSAANTKTSEIAVQKILRYLKEKNSNPFMPGSQKLRNIITEELVHPETAKQLLNIFDRSITLYTAFRKERFIDRTKSFSAPIPRNNLPGFKDIPKGEINKQSKKQKNITCESQRILLMAKKRNYPMEKLLCYDIVDKNLLFDDNGLIVKNEKKYLLMRELEKVLIDYPDEFSRIETDTCLIVDVMLVMRQTPWKDLKDFKGLAARFCNLIVGKAKLQNTKRIDFVFDSYFEKSIKSSEHIRRKKNESIVYNSISGDRQLLKQEDKFWGSSENKILLQRYLREYISMETDLFHGYQLIFSTINDDPCMSNTENSLEMLQRDDIEEADLKIIVHIQHAIANNFQNIYLISSDTDIEALVLYFFKTFKDGGLQTLWISSGISKSAKHIPVHTLATHYGETFCSTILAVHQLSGSDYTSKVGTKHAALQAQPQNHLINFGHDCSEKAIDADIEKAEKYLVKVLKLTSKCKTFNELRVWFHNFSLQGSLVENLPPTSRTIELHIRRAFYVVYLQAHCLHQRVDQLDPLLYGWKEQDELLIPETVQILLPPSDELVFNCTGETCTRNSCPCVAAGVSCISFCECQKSNTCKNVYN